MKIGIVTYHRAHNYGALLQAIALRKKLFDLGHEAYYIDYWPDYHKHIYEFQRPPIKNIIKSPKSIFKYAIMKKSKTNRIKAFEKFISTYIEPYCQNKKSNFDIIIYGSDQIWRKQKEMRNYNPVYFGHNQFITKKHISYAASIDSIPSNKEDISYFRQLLSRLDDISVREEGLSLFCNNIGIANKQVLDPTFLLTSKEWDNIFNLNDEEKIEHYAVFYSIRSGAFNQEYIKDFCNRRNLKLITIHGNAIKHETEADLSSINPRDFVRLIRNSEFVFTSSFHGMAFAIIYKKPFFVSTDFGTDRIKSIVSQFELTNHWIDGRSCIPPINDIDYEHVAMLIEKKKKLSIDYLNNSTFASCSS